MIIAKTDPVQSLGEHTEELLIRYEHLKKYYGDKIHDDSVWELLYIAAKYHDVGKAYIHFQNEMKKALGKSPIPTKYIHIPHNYLSPFFLPLRKLRLNKYDRRVLVEAIAYHHERDSVVDTTLLQKVADDHLVTLFKEITQEFIKKNMTIDFPQDTSTFNYIEQDLSRQRIKYKIDDKQSYKYVLVKGLLHRLDHAASADVAIEVDVHINLSEITHKYLQKVTNKTSSYLRPLQTFSNKHQKENMILIAQTGMGKTEAALLWAGKKKTFFTVPLRVSLNALYNRVVKSMEYENAGLLHSTSIHHLTEAGGEEWEVIHDHSRQFAQKLTFTTIDQLLKFPFKFRGYEKYFATLAYSCIIIDEIQAYSPWIVAVIIKALEMIKHIGGQFLIMTATFPTIYLDTMKERGIIDESTVIKTFYDNSMLRHRVALKEETIENSIHHIIESAKTKKVLVIVNTINQAIKLYERIIVEVPKVYTRLFHARFIQKDRQAIESSLFSFNKDCTKTGVWITTQIVEASIDIDFDELHTELAPLDSLFQRFGRCYRQRIWEKQENNVFIYTKDISGLGFIYNKDIMTLSEQLIREHIENSDSAVDESSKMEMVASLYSKKRLAGTDYYDEYKKALRQLDIEDYALSHREAQRQLRGEDSVLVIPRVIYDQLTDTFLQLEKEEDKQRRSELRRKIERHTCSVNRRMFRNFLHQIDFYQETKYGKYPVMNYAYIIDCPYEFHNEHGTGRGLLREIDDEEVFV